MNLIDAVHGIVIWDSLYALFVLTTNLSILIQQLQQGNTSDSIASLVTGGVLVIRGAVGMNTCLKGFTIRQVRIYLIIRLVWDCVLVLFNLIMASLLKISMRSFFQYLFVLVILDGYLNLIIYSYLAHQTQPKEQPVISDESLEIKDDAKTYNINININVRSSDPGAPHEKN